VYVSTGANFATHMDKANAAPLPFNTNCTAQYFTQMVITNESSVTAYVDQVAVSLSFTNCQAAFTNLAIFERLAGEVQPTAIPPYDYLGDGTDTLADDAGLGHDLTLSLAYGDRVRVFTDSEWKVYELNCAGSWQYVAGTPFDLDGSGFTIGAGTAVELDRVPGADTLAFYPYGGTAVPGGVTQEVYAVGHATHHGRTDLGFPSSYPECIDINSTAFLSTWSGKATAGDELLFFDPVDNVTVKYHWDGDSWRQGTTDLPSREICPGDAFMYYRTGGTFDWIVVN